MKRAIESVGNAPPSSAGNYLMNSRAINSEFLLHSFYVTTFLRRVSLSDLAHDVIRDLCVDIACAVHASSLLRHVLHVVGIGSEKQVVGSHAVSNVTTMADVQPLRYRAVVDYPRQRMNGSSLRLRIIGESHRYRAVAGLFTNSPEPQPAGVRLIHRVPKARQKIPLTGREITSLRTELARRLHSVAASVFKFALFAGKDFCDTIISGHGVTSEIGCKVSRLANVFSARWRAAHILT